MKTLDELKTFYEQVLLPDLQVLEKQRKALANKIIYIGIAAFVAAGACILLVGGKIGRAAPLAISFASPLVIFSFIAAGAVTTGLAWFISVGYRSEFKMAIIERLVRFVDENLRYDAKGCISESEFNSSRIFQTDPNRYKGDDLVCGRVGQTAMKFSEVNAQHESGSGKHRTVIQVFKGIFFIGDFNKHFFGQTFVVPDTSEKFLGKIGQAFQQWNISRPDLVRLEDAEFEKEFVVYSTDQVEARYILSTSLMKRIVDFKRKSGKKIHLSFINAQINVAIGYTRNLFEPKLFSTLLDFGAVEEYFEDLSLATGIVEDLNLNTRVWTRH